MVTTFMLKNEVDGLHPVNDGARKRTKAAGLFPKRVTLALHKPGGRRSEINEWQADPGAWAQRARA
jgi:hypothetical protein